MVLSKDIMQRSSLMGELFPSFNHISCSLSFRLNRQTGSGKTYTMGTGFDRDLNEPSEGIIPRAVRHLFSGIEALQENPYDDDGSYLGNLQFSVAAQFMELYNEEIIDLLDPYSKGKVFKIHEDPAGSITIGGATIR